MFAEKTWWGLAFAGACILFIYLGSENDTNRWHTVEQCRAEVSWKSGLKENELPYLVCRDSFGNGESDGYEEKIKNIDSKETTYSSLALITSILAAIILIPIWLKNSWAFFLARLAEVSSAIRGK